MEFRYLDDLFRKQEKENTKLLEGDKFYILRVDGKSFSKMTQKRFKKPFDEEFNNLIIETVKEVMCEYNYDIIYAYTQSDEISFLFSSKVVGSKRRKLLSLVPATISAVMSVKMRQPVVFDGRIVELTSQDEVIKYFVWRHLDSRRNSLNTAVYWTAICRGLMTKTEASRLLHKNNYDGKIEYLKSVAYPYDEIPLWATNGSSILFEAYEKKGYNPVTKETVKVTRRKVATKEVLSEENLIETVQSILKKNY